MAESRAAQLQREYIESLAAKPPAPVKKDISTDYRGREDRFWIYIHLDRLNPVPYVLQMLNWNEINQVKYGKNTYHYGK